MYYALPASLLINVILTLLLVVLYLKARKNKLTQGSPKFKAQPTQSAAPTESRAGRTLTQARKLLAQNEVAQAVEFCELQLDQNPSNHDLRLFLMAIYVKTQQAEAFENQYDIICEQADTQTISKANALRARFEVSPNDLPKSKIDAIQSERSASRADIYPTNSDVSEIPTLNQTDFQEPEPQESSHQASAHSESEPELAPSDDLDIDFDLEPSLDQTLLDLENEMTQTAMSNVSLTNLKIVIDDDVDQDTETSGSDDEQAPSHDSKASSAISSDETSETGSIDFESNVIEFESDQQEHATGTLSLDDISYELDIAGAADETSLSIETEQSNDSEQFNDLKLNPADTKVDTGEKSIAFDGTDLKTPLTIDQPDDTSSIPTLDQHIESLAIADTELNSIDADNDEFLDEEVALESPSDTSDTTSDQSTSEPTDNSDHSVYQFDLDEDSLGSMDDGNTFDFGEALASDALDQIELDSSHSEPGTFDLSMQFEAVDQSKNSPQANQRSESIDLDGELNFGFSLEPEINATTDTKKDFSVNLDEDELAPASNPKANLDQSFDEDLSDIAEFKQDDIAPTNQLDLDQTDSDEAMPDTEFDFDFEEADSNQEPTLISPALNPIESGKVADISGDQHDSEDFEEDWFASLDREFSDIDSGESTHVNLKLAKEYIRLGEKSGAQSLLEDVLENGADDDRQQAQKLLDSM